MTARAGSLDHAGPEQLAQRLLHSDARALARAISLIEGETPEGRSIVARVFPRTGGAALVGITGPPGAGKSTLISALVHARRRQGRRVAVLSVDPSSPFTRGALLGDRVRMREHFQDHGVFIRSMASRGQHGGLAPATLEAVLLMDAWGADEILIETVGSGQADVDVAWLADTIALVIAPGSGEAIQMLKAGVMEIPDILIVNKADLGRAGATARAVRRALSLGPRQGRPSVIVVSAVDDSGVNQLAGLLDEHRSHMLTTGELTRRRDRNSGGPSSRLCSTACGHGSSEA